ncbi:hypothetical protein GCM10027036_34880 [Flavihumibacter cheonanensis]
MQFGFPPNSTESDSALGDFPLEIWPVDKKLWNKIKIIRKSLCIIIYDPFAVLRITANAFIYAIRRASLKK